MRLRGRLEWLTGQFRWVMAVPATGQSLARIVHKQSFMSIRRLLQ